MSEATQTTEDLELGPIDYIVVEYPDGQPTGAAMPYLVDLVDRGFVRILDIAVLVTDTDGGFRSVTLGDVEAAVAQAEGLGAFAGAATGILDDEDLAEVAAVITPGAAATVLVYENSWAGPFAAALRRGGAQLVASGRIPVNAILAALDALDDEQR